VLSKLTLGFYSVILVFTFVIHSFYLYFYSSELQKRSKDLMHRIINEFVLRRFTRVRAPPW